MRKRILLLDIAKGSDQIKHLLVMGRTFTVLSFCSMLFVVMLGIAGMANQKSVTSPIHSMKGFAAGVSSGWFGDMLEIELPSFHSQMESEPFRTEQWGALIMRTLMDIDPTDPRSLMASELPGMRANDAVLIRKGISTDPMVGPQDHAPSQPHEETDPANVENVVPGVADSPVSTPAVIDKEKKKETIAFIYHTHNQESWHPELDSKKKDPSSKTKNITLVGKRLADKLEEYGVGAMHSDTDYSSEVPDYRWELSYKYSMKTVKEAIASSDGLQFFFDLHRDSQKRKYTTIDIDGKSYAQVYFIIGHKNPNWEKNEAFASQIHDALEEKYPGISRGIWSKTAATGNAEYNQSLSPGSVLIEVGGVDNTLEESYRTADALAKIISEIFWSDQGASAVQGGINE